MNPQQKQRPIEPSDDIPAVEVPERHIKHDHWHIANAPLMPDD